MFRLFFKKPRNLKDDILSGLTVALALVPEAVAFAFVAGVDPLVGLYAAFFVGLITSTIGGRPGMISGATGAMAVVMTAFVVIYGLEYLFAAVIVAGIFQVLAGVFRLGKFVRLLPHPVMLGFVNGLAIVIGLAQFGQFKEKHEVIYNEATQNFEVVGQWMSASSSTLWIMIAIIVATMAIIQYLPKLTRAIPAPLVAIIVGTLLVTFTSIKSPTVRDVLDTQRVLQAEKDYKQKEFVAAKGDYTLNELESKGDALAAAPVESEKLGEIKEGLKAGLPTFAIPTLDWSDWTGIKTVVLLGLTLASIGLIESLMTLSLIDEITETRGSSNRECVGQGVANIVTGFFGGMGGCAMIGQSMININSGGRGRTSGISAALFLFAFILFAPALIEMIPIASLVGVMFMVVIATFEWSSLRLLGKIPRSDFLVIVAVSTVTVFLDLAIAVGVGIVISALVFAWNRSKEITLEKTDEKEGLVHYEVEGNIFFGSITEFKALFNPKTDPQDVYLSFEKSKLCDHSSLEAVHSLSEKYKALGKCLHLTALSPECANLLRKAGDTVEVSVKGTDKVSI
ncbi:MAG: SulP family inorganic anion transporter [Lentisphaeria bacterium]|nr:SulP family inorganic anion transporter [Lentisphaeria bacterium]